MAKESGNDPIRKAETVRDIVQSISKIPDVIKREIYLRECARLMDVSEEVLFNALSQILAKNQKEQSKKNAQNEKPFEVISTPKTPVEKIDVKLQYELKILEILLLYAKEVTFFDEQLLHQNENGELVHVTERKQMSVYQKIMTELQEDEIEFSNSVFKELYLEIIRNIEENDDFQTEMFIARLESEKAKIVTDIFMDNEKHRLHNWERKNVFIKDRKDNIGRFLQETLLNLRLLLINERVNQLISETNPKQSEMDIFLESVQQYKSLEVFLSRKLDSVVRRF